MNGVHETKDSQVGAVLRANRSQRVNRKDVAIIGGSTAGLFAAYLLAREGVSVRVFEAAERVELRLRTLIVTSRMNDWAGSLCESAVVNRIRHVELFADGRVAAISLHRPDLVIERSRLLQALRVQAENSGAIVSNGHRFLNVQPNGKGMTLILARNGSRHPARESADTLVGADGTFSSVAASIGRAAQPTVALVQAVVPLPGDLAPDTVRVRFRPEETPYFYWLIPHSQTHGVIGLIAADDRQGRSCLTRVLHRKRLMPSEFQSARIPLYDNRISFRCQVGRRPVYFVGDAAGHVKVSTVGGIITGFRGAKGVVEAILNGGASRELRALRRELEMHRLIRWGLNGFTQKDYARLLEMLTPAARGLLGLFTRDETPKLLLNLLLREPRLLRFGIKALIRGNRPPM